ncbi:MAG TPA: hypothetical protein VM487_03175 [Phycisphaerae bacterium]|nr:hypothetical protein [Phycisphaerae bacterium]
MAEIPRTTPDSWRVLREAMGDKRKWIAHAIRRSPNLIDHWCVPPPSPELPDSAGQINRLDEMIGLLRACGDDQAPAVLDFLCRQFRGRFIPADGGQGDGKLFRDPQDAIPHLKALLDELKKKKSASRRVIRVHLEEAFVILTSNLTEQENSHDAHNAS